jgi:hypothetical protein
VTAVGVGSGALLGRLGLNTARGVINPQPSPGQERDCDDSGYDKGEPKIAVHLVNEICERSEKTDTRDKDDDNMRQAQECGEQQGAGNESWRRAFYIITVETGRARMTHSGHSNAKHHRAKRHGKPENKEQNAKETEHDGSFCLTSKMSHDDSWRAACDVTIPIRLFHFHHALGSTRRDSCRRWL